MYLCKNNKPGNLLPGLSVCITQLGISYLKNMTNNLQIYNYQPMMQEHRYFLLMMLFEYDQKS